MTLLEAQALAACLPLNEELILDGDRQELQIWQRCEAGSRSAVLLTDWNDAQPALAFPMMFSTSH